MAEHASGSPQAPASLGQSAVLAAGWLATSGLCSTEPRTRREQQGHDRLVAACRGEHERRAAVLLLLHVRGCALQRVAHRSLVA